MSEQFKYGFVGGRRRRHSLMRLRRELRRVEVARLLRQYGYFHGIGAQIARAIKVSEPTVSRDIKAVMGTARPCPECGAWRPSKRGQITPISLLAASNADQEEATSDNP